MSRGEILHRHLAPAPRRRRGLIAAASLAALLAATPAVLAAGADPAPAGKPATGDLTELSLEELMQIEIPKVVAASRFEQQVTEAPASVSIVTADDIRAYGYRTLAAILRSVRGFYASYDRSYTYAGIRGFRGPGDFNTRVLLLLDGHRLNDNIYDSALLGTEGMPDVELIERVEVVRGPSSSLYGTNAFFAVVNVVTKGASEVPGVAVSLAAGSWGTVEGRASYGRADSTGPEAVLSASASRSDGQNLYFAEFASPETNNGVAVACDYDRFERFFGRMTAGALRIEGAYSSREKGIPTASFGTIFGDPRSKTRDERAFLDASYERDVPAGWRLSGRGYYDRYAYDGDYETDLPPPTLNVDRARSDYLGAEVKLSRSLPGKNRFSAGVEYRDSLETEQRNYDVDPYVLYSSSDWGAMTWGAYVEDEFAPTPKWSLSAGLRYDDYETFGGTTNPRLGAIFMPRRGTAIKLLYGRAFRAPSAYEITSLSAGMPGGINRDLGPETIRTWEAVLEHYAGDGLKVSVSAFSYGIDGLVRPVYFEDLDSWRYENFGQVSSRGLEAEVERRWGSGARGRLSYALQRSVDDSDGSLLTDSPRHLAKLNFTAPLPRRGLGLGLEAQFTSSRKTLAGREAGAFLVANLTFFARDLAAGLDLSASVYNLLDRSYGDPASEQTAQDILEQDGRSARLTLAYRF